MFWVHFQATMQVGQPPYPYPQSAFNNQQPSEAPAASTWKCTCGAENTAKFCMECGAKKSAAPKKYKCDKCGFVPEGPANPPKFCPECGDPFNDSDAE